MCIMFVYRNPDAGPSEYKLILIANRDEFYTRPADPAHYWPDYPGCLGGTDMEPGRENGTWLAVNHANARIGVILNLHGNPKSTNTKGRGFLVRDYLIDPDSTIEHANKLHKTNQETHCYSPYNFVMVDMKSCDIFYLSSEENYPGPKKIDKSILGCGNSGLETPYQKVLFGEKQFKNIVKDAKTSDQQRLMEDLIELLKSTKRHLPDKELEKRAPKEQNELSSIFVHHEKAKYGTRTHTIILVDNADKLTFIEETMMTDGTWKRQIFNNLME
ncbi:transport and Golgi organization protein 2 [Trichogramma pretiosum]|uniref:transport and Golgi organization protein 2 n=1 Tax=Trichogramma pretiosum TaxID=7493 RepID=UPI0006C9AF67|nr:transport and Golgi organization protein 2 [Trichogramma pretiosum]